MKKQSIWRMGGLRGKVFKLCIMLVISAILGFAIVGMLQLRTLQRMANDTGKSQAETIRVQSEASMMKMTRENMMNIAEQATYNTDYEMWELRNQAVLIAAQVKDIFENPDNYAETNVEPPKLENNGRPALQIMFSETANPTEEDMIMARKLANLEDLMEKMLVESEYNTQDLIIALPCGVSLDMDILSDWKFDDDGNLQPYDPLIRPWWQQAVESGDVVATYAVHSSLLDVSEMEFGVPVYVDGELKAVVESSIRLETFRELVSEMTQDMTGFSIVVSNDGTLVYSPFDEGDLKMDNMLSRNVFDSGNEELNDVIRKALKGKVGFDEIKVDGKLFCVAYAPMETVSWTQMVFVDKAELLKPTEDLLKEMDETTGETLRQYEKSFRESSWLTVGVMILLVFNAILVALMFSGRLTSPINRMTETVRSISGDDFNFEMDDVYRTGDEIELLAETFGELSERPKKYIHEIMDITAEKERIGAELNVATGIQSSMLPTNFPVFPDRKEFDL